MIRLRKALILERKIQDLRAAASRSIGWWSHKADMQTGNSTEPLDQLFPLNGYMLKYHRDALLHALEPYSEIKSPFQKDQLPQWLGSNTDCDFTNLIDLIDFLLGIHASKGLPIQGAVLAAMIDLAEHSIDEVQFLVDEFVGTLEAGES